MGPRPARWQFMRCGIRRMWNSAHNSQVFFLVRAKKRKKYMLKMDLIRLLPFSPPFFRRLGNNFFSLSDFHWILRLYEIEIEMHGKLWYFDKYFSNVNLQGSSIDESRIIKISPPVYFGPQHFSNQQRWKKDLNLPTDFHGVRAEWILSESEIRQNVSQGWFSSGPSEVVIRGVNRN